MIDVTTFQTELASLCADVDALLAHSVTTLEAAPVVEEDEVVMTALFGGTIPPHNPSRAVGKRHYSDHIFDTEEARRLKN